ncbi:hypothetical protein F01_420059 [Burkholderia cenocepacia]|nr:hypothetical protein F01_420059 [Burkholderia cenocepacia]
MLPEITGLNRRIIGKASTRIKSGAIVAIEIAIAGDRHAPGDTIQRSRQILTKMRRPRHYGT